MPPDGAGDGREPSRPALSEPACPPEPASRSPPTPVSSVVVVIVIVNLSLSPQERWLAWERLSTLTPSATGCPPPILSTPLPQVCRPAACVSALLQTRGSRAGVCSSANYTHQQRACQLHRELSPSRSVVGSIARLRGKRLGRDAKQPQPAQCSRQQVQRMKMSRRSDISG